MSSGYEEHHPYDEDEHYGQQDQYYADEYNQGNAQYDPNAQYDQQAQYDYNQAQGHQQYYDEQDQQDQQGYYQDEYYQDPNHQQQPYYDENGYPEDAYAAGPVDPYASSSQQQQQMQQTRYGGYQQPGAPAKRLESDEGSETFSDFTMRGADGDYYRNSDQHNNYLPQSGVESLQDNSSAYGPSADNGSRQAYRTTASSQISYNGNRSSGASTPIYGLDYPNALPAGQRSHEPYPAWTAENQAPLSKEEIEDILLTWPTSLVSNVILCVTCMITLWPF